MKLLSSLKVLLLAGTFFLSGLSKISAQEKDTLKNTFLAYPLVFYLPETRYGAGLATSYNFRFNKKDTISPPTQIQFGGAYTQNKQILIYLPFDAYWRERKNQLSGEIGYYDYLYYFFGTQEISQDFEESYSVRYPRFRINYLRKIIPNVFAGARWWYDDFSIYRYQEDGTLAKGIIAGSGGGRSSGPGIVFNFDKRDNVYFSRKGHYLELVYHNQDELFASNYNFSRYRFDYRYFQPFGKNMTLASQFFGDFMQGNVPFFQMTGIGGPKRMRGYIDGRYRDHQLLLAQTEWRHFLSRRWGYVLFASSALVEHEWSDFNFAYTKFAFGGGIRFAFDPEKKINIRLDAAFGKNTYGFYLTVGESF
jgi:outer membrane protein assembly factor BamA